MADNTIAFNLKLIDADKEVDSFAAKVQQKLRAAELAGKFDVHFTYPSKRAQYNPSTKKMGYVQHRNEVTGEMEDTLFPTSAKLRIDSRPDAEIAREQRDIAARGGIQASRGRQRVRRLHQELKSHYRRLNMTGMPNIINQYGLGVMTELEAVRALEEALEPFRKDKAALKGAAKETRVRSQIKQLTNRGHRLASELGSTFNISQRGTDLESWRDDLRTRVNDLQEQVRSRNKTRATTRKNQSYSFKTKRIISEMKQLEAKHKVAANVTSTTSDPQGIYEELQQNAILQKDAIKLAQTQRGELRKKRQRFVRSGKKALARRLYEQFEKPLMDYEIQKYADILGFKPSASATTFDLGKGQIPTDYKTRQERQLAARTLRQQASAKKDATKLRQERMRSTLMSGASAGIGLLGNAGMPLLNVAFAAWSGGGQAALIAGVATAIGELVRHIETMRSTALEASKAVGAVSTAFSRSEAMAQSAQVIHGIAVQGTTIQSNKMYSDYWTNKTGAARNFENIYGSTKNAIKKYGYDVMSGDIKKLLFLDTFSFIKDADTLRKDLESKELPNFRSSYRNFVASNQYNKLDSDPYEAWKRTQETFGDPAKMAEQQVFRDTLKTLNDQLKIMEREEADRLGNKRPSLESHHLVPVP